MHLYQHKTWERSEQTAPQITAEVSKPQHWWVFLINRLWFSSRGHVLLLDRLSDLARVLSTSVWSLDQLTVHKNWTYFFGQTDSSETATWLDPTCAISIRLVYIACYCSHVLVLTDQGFPWVYGRTVLEGNGTDKLRKRSDADLSAGWWWSYSQWTLR